MTRRERIEEIIAPYRSCPFKAPKVGRRGKPHTTVDYSGISEAEKLKRDEFYMSCALELAREALLWGEVPVGAVIVRGDEIISADFNGRETEKNALCHAETTSIDMACRSMGGWRLPGCELYVTLEPCIMCAGAIISARVPRVVFGAEDPKAGFLGGVADIREMPLNHKPVVTSGVCREGASELLSRFFEKKRER